MEQSISESQRVRHKILFLGDIGMKLADYHIVTCRTHAIF